MLIHFNPQGENEDELPEAVACCYRLIRPDVPNATLLTAAKRTYKDSPDPGVYTGKK